MARRALAAAILLGPGALNAATQQGVVLECNEVVSLRATPTFDPPVQGPLTFEWRDATGGVIGTDQFLKTAFPRGSQVLAMVVTAPGGRTATNRMAIDVRDTLKPGVSVARPIVDLTRAQAEAGVNIIALAGITAVDQCDPSPRVVASSTGRFPVGDTLASVVAIDAAGLTSDAAIVTVRVAGAVAPRPTARAPAAPAPPAAPRPPVAGRAQAARPEVPGPQGAGRGSIKPAATPARPEAGAPTAPPNADAGIPATPGLPQAGAAVPVAPPPSAVGPVNPAPIAAPVADDAQRSRGWPALGLLLGVASAIAVFLFLASTRKGRTGVPLRVQSRPHVDPGIQRVILPPAFAPRFDVRIQPTIHAGEQHVILPPGMHTTI